MAEVTTGYELFRACERAGCYEPQGDEMQYEITLPDGMKGQFRKVDGQR